MKKKKEDWIKRIKNLITANKKYLIIIGAIVVVVLVAFAFVIIRGKQSKTVEQKPLTLIEQYKMQLPELEERAKGGNANDLQAYGVALYATGNLSEAEQAYKKQIQADGGSFMSHNNLANILRDEKKFEEAVAEYEKAISLSPNSANSYINLASLYQYSLNDFDKAIEIYDRAINSNPNIADFPNLAGLAYEQKGDIENAEKYFQKAIALQEDNQTAKAALERLKK